MENLSILLIQYQRNKNRWKRIRRKVVCYKTCLTEMRRKHLLCSSLYVQSTESLDSEEQSSVKMVEVYFCQSNFFSVSVSGMDSSVSHIHERHKLAAKDSERGGGGRGERRRRRRRREGKEKQAQYLFWFLRSSWPLELQVSPHWLTSYRYVSFCLFASFYHSSHPNQWRVSERAFREEKKKHSIAREKKREKKRERERRQSKQVKSVSEWRHMPKMRQE